MERGSPAAHLLLLPLLLLCTAAASSHGHHPHMVYIVYLGGHQGTTKTVEEIHGAHHSFLLSVKNSDAEARESLLYSYKNSINGFAALLSQDEAAKLSEMEEVVSTFPSEPKRWSMHTTRSWEFLGHEEGLMGDQKERMRSRANYGKGTIVGLLDSGIWPESESFHDGGMGAVPKRWKGICQGGDSFNSSHCNRKLIGARYYLKGYETHYGTLNRSNSYRSPRDGDGHGTHTASTVGGRVVRGVSALGGFASGTASGGAPLARLAMYKVCWPIPGSPNPNIENTCFDADMLAAMDDAIGDGVDVLSVSIGATGAAPAYDKDALAIGSLHAVKRNIVVVFSGGNSGPAASTVSNLAPWMITVGASSIDRGFPAPIVLGNGVVVKGQTVTPYKLKRRYPLIYAGDAVVNGTAANATGQCLPGCLVPEKVKGKIVVCLRGLGLRVAKGMEVKRAGGAAIILGNSLANGNEIPVDAHVLPGTAVASSGADAILEYIRTSKEPTATLLPAKTVLDVKPAPVMAAFSSRGPNPIDPHILKPDITAPGLNILAAWSGSSPPTKLVGDRRRVEYNLMSGTSMSCPHVSATAALLRSIHPKWSSAAIRSAMMTTATRSDTQGRPLRNAAGEVAGPFELGSGHVRPTHASDPGLIYDATYSDYVLFACSSSGAQLDPSWPCPKRLPHPAALNHPSVVFTNLTAAATVRRTVTKVGSGGERYHVAVTEPRGVTVDISPQTLSFHRVGEKKSFTITVSVERRKNKKGAAAGEYAFGSYSWNDGVHEVTSPIVVGFA